MESSVVRFAEFRDLPAQSHIRIVVAESEGSLASTCMIVHALYESLGFRGDIERGFVIKPAQKS